MFTGTSAVKFFHKCYKRSVEVGLLMEVLTVNNVASWVYKMLNVSRIVQKYIFLEGKVFSRMSRVIFFSKKKPLKKWTTFWKAFNHDWINTNIFEWKKWNFCAM